MEDLFKEKIKSGDCIQHSIFEYGFGYYVTVDGFDYTVYETLTEITDEDGITEDVISSYTWEQADENEVKEFLEAKV